MREALNFYIVARERQDLLHYNDTDTRFLRPFNGENINVRASLRRVTAFKLLFEQASCPLETRAFEFFSAHESEVLVFLGLGIRKLSLILTAGIVYSVPLSRKCLVFLDRLCEFFAPRISTFLGYSSLNVRFPDLPQLAVDFPFTFHTSGSFD